MVWPWTTNCYSTIISPPAQLSSFLDRSCMPPPVQGDHGVPSPLIIFPLGVVGARLLAQLPPTLYPRWLLAPHSPAPYVVFLLCSATIEIMGLRTWRKMRRRRLVIGTCSEAVHYVKIPKRVVFRGAVWNNTNCPPRAVWNNSRFTPPLGGGVK